MMGKFFDQLTSDAWYFTIFISAKLTAVCALILHAIRFSPYEPSVCVPEIDAFLYKGSVEGLVIMLGFATAWSSALAKLIHAIHDKKNGANKNET